MFFKTIERLLSLALMAGITLLNGPYGFRASVPASIEENRQFYNQDDLSAIIEKYREIIPDLMKERRIPGLAIALVDDQQVLWSEGFGFTDWDRKVPVTQDTPFSIQSMSKSFTAVAVLFAVQEGFVDLETPIDQYLPNFHVNSIFEEHPESKITLLHLLSHTAGFTHEAPVGNNYDSIEGPFEDHIASISDTWLKFPVGKGYAYSNLGIDLAGYIVQVRSGMPFQEFVKENLLDPLGMNNTSLDLEFIRANPNKAIGHTSIMTKIPLIPMMPAGGVYSSANDMARYLLFHINQGVSKRVSLLSEDLLQTMYAPQFIATRQEGYGLGIGVGRTDGILRLSHGGGGFGFLSMMDWYPELKVGLVWLTNATDHDLQGWLSDQILTEVIQGSPDLYRGRLSTAPSFLIKTFRSKDIRPLTILELRKIIQDASLNEDAVALSRWKKYSGIYGLKDWGRVTELLDLNIKENHLYLGTQRLSETQPGLFFTADGEVLDLRRSEPTWRNIRVEKIDRGFILFLKTLMSVSGLVFLVTILGAFWRFIRSILKRRTAEPIKQESRNRASQVTRILLVLASILGTVTLVVLAKFPIFLFGIFPLPNPNLQPWQQALLLSPFLLLVICIFTILPLAIRWKNTSRISGSIAHDTFTLTVLFVFAVIVCF